MEGQAIIKRRKIIKVGDSYAVTLPPEWIKQYNLETEGEVLILADKDLRICSPKEKERIEKYLYKRVSELVKEAEIEKR